MTIPGCRCGDDSPTSFDYHLTLQQNSLNNEMTGKEQLLRMPFARFLLPLNKPKIIIFELNSNIFKRCNFA